MELPEELRAATGELHTVEEPGLGENFRTYLLAADRGRFVAVFDQVCQAASQDALRRLVRGMPSETVLDMAGAESETLRVSIGVDLEGYGVVVHKVVLIAVRPPDAYMASLEARLGSMEVWAREIVNKNGEVWLGLKLASPE